MFPAPPITADQAVGLQVKIFLAFTYDDGTTSSGTTIIDISDEFVFRFYSVLSADEANEAVSNICYGCSFVMEIVECVSNCEIYS